MALPPGWYQVQYYCPISGVGWVDLDNGYIQIFPGPQEVNVVFGFCG